MVLILTFICQLKCQIRDEHSERHALVLPLQKGRTKKVALRPLEIDEFSFSSDLRCWRPAEKILNPCE